MNERESQITIEKRAFAITVNLIRLMHMEELWSRGIPGLKRFVFILQQYMKFVSVWFDSMADCTVPSCCPTSKRSAMMSASSCRSGSSLSSLTYLVFSCYSTQTLPFPLLFRLWGFVLLQVSVQSPFHAALAGHDGHFHRIAPLFRGLHSLQRHRSVLPYDEGRPHAVAPNCGGAIAVIQHHEGAGGHQRANFPGVRRGVPARSGESRGSGHELCSGAVGSDGIRSKVGTNGR